MTIKLFISNLKILFVHWKIGAVLHNFTQFIVGRSSFVGNRRLIFPTDVTSLSKPNWFVHRKCIKYKK